MKKLKKIILVFIVALLLVLPISTKEVNAEEEKKVKVYVFEAGGCHWCQQEKQYLQGLETYGKKFEIIVKELYVDTDSWAEGADYELGKKVATAFNEAGFKQAKYDSTPFVVISDIYAASKYNDDLEQYIDKAFNEGDKDIVGCFERNELNCLSVAKETKEDISSLIFWVIKMLNVLLYERYL